MLNELREFAIKGNVVDMAVGIMIGGAFSTVIKSAVDDILMPPLGLATGGIVFTSKFVVLQPGALAGPPYATLEAAQQAGAVTLRYGLFVNQVISFIIVALALFVPVRWVNRLRRPDTPPAPTTRPRPFCLSHVAKEASRCAQCTSELQPAQ